MLERLSRPCVLEPEDGIGRQMSRYGSVGRDIGKTRAGPREEKRADQVSAVRARKSERKRRRVGVADLRMTCVDLIFPNRLTCGWEDGQADVSSFF